MTKHNIRSEYTPEEYHQIKIAAAIANKSIHQYVHDMVMHAKHIDDDDQFSQTLHQKMTIAGIDKDRRAARIAALEEEAAITKNLAPAPEEK